MAPISIDTGRRRHRLAPLTLVLLGAGACRSGDGTPPRRRDASCPDATPLDHHTLDCGREWARTVEESKASSTYWTWQDDDGRPHGESVKSADWSFLVTTWFESGAVADVTIGNIAGGGGFERSWYDIGNGTSAQPLRHEGWNDDAHGYHGYVTFWNEDGSIDAGRSGYFRDGDRAAPPIFDCRHGLWTRGGIEGRGYWIEVDLAKGTYDDKRLYFRPPRVGFDLVLYRNGHYDHDGSFFELGVLSGPPEQGAGYWVRWTGQGQETRVDPVASHFYVDGSRADPRDCVR